MFFSFVCKLESSIPDEKYRDCLFEIVKAIEILHRFHTSHEFWEKFSVRDESLLDIMKLSLLNCVSCVLKTCSRANVPCVLTCSRANVPCVLTCQRASIDVTIFSFAAIVADIAHTVDKV